MILKKLIRKALTILFAKSPSEILRRLAKSKANTVSFDIFDTLIERLVNCPEDIFELIEAEYRENFGSAEAIAKMRIHAQRLALKSSPFCEVTLEEIYSEIELTKEKRDWLKNREIELELTLCVPKNDGLALLKKTQDLGKKIILVSDMYLPAEVIKRMLSQCSITGYDALFLSSEERKRKQDGSIFKEVLTRRHLHPSELIHIGDNVRSDFVIPTLLGIDALLLKVSHRKRKSNVSLAQSIVENYILHNKGGYTDTFVQMGFSILGPMLYGFSKWLLSYQKKENFETIFFLMREGALLKKAFDLLSENTSKTFLLYVSRQSTTTPFLDEAKNLDAILQMLQARRLTYTVSDLLSACCLNKEAITKALSLSKRSGKDNVRRFSKVESDSFFQRLSPFFQRCARENKENFYRYLSKTPIASRNLVVDVGYHGTIQKNLQKAFAHVDFKGAYLGYFTSNKAPRIDATGCYFNEKEHPRLYDIALSSGVFELLFLATVGTTLGFDSDGQPVLSEPDNDANQTKRIAAAQEAALTFIKGFMSIDAVLNLDAHKVDYFSFYSDFVRHPTKAYLRAIEGLNFRDSHVERMIPKRTRLYYALHPKESFLNFVESPCKVYFLKALCPLNLPYYSFLVWLRRLDQKHKETH